MATLKLIGKGATVTFGGSAINNIITITPPARTYELVDQTAMVDTLATYQAASETFSECSFTHFWDPTDAAHDLLETYFGNAANANCVITILTSSNSNTTMTFSGFVSSLAPGAVTRDGMVVRDVTIQRVGAIS